MYNPRLETVEVVDENSCMVYVRPFLMGSDRPASSVEDHGMLFPISKEVFMSRYRQWIDSDRYIQDVFNNVSADHREFLLSGLTPEQWDAFTEESLSDESQ